MLRALRREVRVLRRISGNDSVVGFLAAVLDPAAPLLVMEWMPVRRPPLGSRFL